MSITETAPLPVEPKPEHRREHDKLDVFVGDWQGHGKAAGGAPMRVHESFAWLEGGFFLLGRFEQIVAGARHVGASTVGFDLEAGAWRCHMVDNLGYERSYVMANRGGGVWSITGERERATYRFSDGGTVEVRWEHRPEGAQWRDLCAYAMTNHRARH